MLTEDDEQIKLAKYLNRLDVLWCHVPNGGKRSARYGAKLKAMGVRAGVPDILIFTKYIIDSTLNGRGIAIELKRAKPARSCVSAVQKKWLSKLACNEWLTTVCYGADEAIDFLRGLEFIHGD